MKKEILMVTADKKLSRSVQDALAESDCTVHIVDSVEKLLIRVQSGDKIIAMLDLDVLALDNVQIKRIVRANPQTVLIGASNRWFHPDLKEAMSQHIFACLTKPIDMEELQYLLKGIFSKTDNQELMER